MEVNYLVEAKKMPNSPLLPARDPLLRRHKPTATHSSKAKLLKFFLELSVLLFSERGRFLCCGRPLGRGSETLAKLPPCLFTQDNGRYGRSRLWGWRSSRRGRSRQRLQRRCERVRRLSTVDRQR